MSLEKINKKKPKGKNFVSRPQILKGFLAFLSTAVSFRDIWGRDKVMERNMILTFSIHGAYSYSDCTP